MDEVPVALGLPRRDTNWHEMDERPSWTCSVSSQTGPQDFSSPNAQLSAFRQEECGQVYRP